MQNEELSSKLAKATAQANKDASMVSFHYKDDKYPMFAIASTGDVCVLILIEGCWERATKEQADLVMVEAHLRGLL